MNYTKKRLPLTLTYDAAMEAMKLAERTTEPNIGIGSSVINAKFFLRLMAKVEKDNKKPFYSGSYRDKRGKVYAVIP